MVYKKLFSALCLLLSQPIFAVLQSPEALAESFLNSVTSQRGTLFPSDLIYPGNLAKLPREQLTILSSNPAVHLFVRTDFKYRIAAAGATKRHEGLDYPFPPSHVIIISHINWRSNDPALSLDVAEIDGSWWIVVPILSAELVEIIRSGIARHDQQVDELEAKVSPDEVLRLTKVISSQGKYDLIEELACRFSISTGAAIIFLSKLRKSDESR